MEYVLIILLILIAGILYEYRIRRPDHIVLYESQGMVRQRTGRFYPRHFSLAIPSRVHSSTMEVQAEARGRLELTVRLTASVAAAREHLQELVRMGGWSEECVAQALNELEVLIETRVRAFTEQLEIEELTTESLQDHLSQEFGTFVPEYGLEILSLSVHSVEPVDRDIIEAMQKQESARLMEQTENINQRARVQAAKARVQADEEIADAEHQLQLKKLELQESEEEQQAALEKRRVEEEIERRRMELDIENQELTILRDNPELLLLTPQLTRLAEASQQLRNARTVVSLSPGEGEESSPLLQMFRKLMQNIGPVDDDKNS